MKFSIYMYLFVGTLLNVVIASQRLFGDERGFLEDLFDSRRHNKSKLAFLCLEIPNSAN